jgi:hypothetical protein
MLIRAPQAWSPFAVAAVAMLVLAALDLAGAYAAKEAVARRSTGFAVLGITFFVLLFWVYASSLQYAELGPVTFGWIVVLQVGVVLLDRFHYGSAVPRGHWVAIVVMVGAQAYLLLSPSGPAAPALTQDRTPPAQVAAVVDVRTAPAVTISLPARRAQATGPRHRA